MSSDVATATPPPSDAGGASAVAADGSVPAAGAGAGAGAGVAGGGSGASQGSIAGNLNGKWRVVESSPNFEEFLKAADVPWLFRKIMLSVVTPTCTIAVSSSGRVADVKMKMGPKTIENTVYLDKPFVMETPKGKRDATAKWDNNVLKVTITEPPDKFIHQWFGLAEDGRLRVDMINKDGMQAYRLWERV